MNILIQSIWHFIYSRQCDWPLEQPVPGFVSYLKTRTSTLNKSPSECMNFIRSCKANLFLQMSTEKQLPSEQGYIHISIYWNILLRPMKVNWAESSTYLEAPSCCILITWGIKSTEKWIDEREQKEFFGERGVEAVLSKNVTKYSRLRGTKYKTTQTGH